MSEEEKESERQAFYGQRLGSVKVQRQPDRHPKTGQRFFHHHPDGTISNQNLKEEEDQTMAFTSVEDLKKRRPDLFKEITEDGYNAGFAIGEKIGQEMVAKAKAEERAAQQAAATAEIERQRGIEEANRFESKVAKLRAEGVGLGTAITRIALEDPKAHQDYLDRVQAGQAGKLA